MRKSHTAGLFLLYRADLRQSVQTPKFQYRLRMDSGPCSRLRQNRPGPFCTTMGQFLLQQRRFGAVTGIRIEKLAFFPGGRDWPIMRRTTWTARDLRAEHQVPCDIWLRLPAALWGRRTLP